MHFLFAGKVWELCSDTGEQDPPEAEANRKGNMEFMDFS